MHKRLTHLTIRNFKRFSRFSLEHARGFNLILGANDVGKTSLLEAVLFIAGLGNPEMPARILQSRRIGVSSLRTFAYLFTGTHLESPIQLQATVEGDRLETRRVTLSAVRAGALASIDSGPSRAAVSTRELRDLYAHGRASQPESEGLTSAYTSLCQNLRYAGETSVEGHETGEKIEGHLHVTGDPPGKIQVTLSSQPSRESVIQAFLLHPGMGYDTDAVADVIAKKEKHALLSTLQSIIPSISEIAVEQDLAYVDTGFPEMIPFNSLGGGCLRAAQIVSNGVRDGTNMVLIDDIESGLHYKSMGALLTALLDLVDRNRVQVFATTHSIDLLHALHGLLGGERHRHMQRDCASFVLAQNMEHEVISYRYDFDEFDHCLTRGIEIR